MTLLLLAPLGNELCSLPTTELSATSSQRNSSRSGMIRSEVLERLHCTRCPISNGRGEQINAVKLDAACSWSHTLVHFSPPNM